MPKGEQILGDHRLRRGERDRPPARKDRLRSQPASRGLRMEALGQAFEERLNEIESYLEFLQGIETEARSGPPRLGSGGILITAQQQRILYSCVFLQLYNLVDA